MSTSSRIDVVNALLKASQESEYNKKEVSSFKDYFEKVEKRKKRGRPRKQKHWQTSQKEKRREQASLSKENQTMIVGECLVVKQTDNLDVRLEETLPTVVKSKRRN